MGKKMDEWFWETFGLAIFCGTVSLVANLAPEGLSLRGLWLVAFGWALAGFVRALAARS